MSGHFFSREYADYFVELQSIIGQNVLMIVRIAKPFRFFVRRFPGTKIDIAKILIDENTQACEYAGVIFPYDRKLMQPKRLIEFACGALERHEFTLACKFITGDDIVVEFGMGMGITAALLQKISAPREHYCYEANPAVIQYAKDLFRRNGMDVSVENKALGNGRRLPFFATKNFLLSSFDKPSGGTEFREITVPTICIDTVIQSRKPTAIISDIEGAEHAFLAPRNYGNVRKIIIELDDKVFRGGRREEVIARFEAASFRRVAKSGKVYCFIRD